MALVHVSTESSSLPHARFALRLGQSAADQDRSDTTDAVANGLAMLD